jgi:hypothetical protein
MSKSPLQIAKNNGFGAALRKEPCDTQQYYRGGSEHTPPSKEAVEYLAGYIQGCDARNAGVKHIEEEA